MTRPSPASGRRRAAWRSAYTVLLGLAAVLAALPAHAVGDSRLDYAQARHLLARTGFGATDAEIRALVGVTRQAAVDGLLATARTTAITPLPDLLATAAPLLPPRGPDATPEARKAFVRAQVQEGLLLRAWWLQEMLATPSPLTERMTLFWHNHFVSAQPKVRLTRLMLEQNRLLRANALGNFATLLHAVAKDPAMIVYLDGARNRRGAPNENFAREVMELFTLGEGHYSEDDIKEAARAFTGWSVDRSTGEFVFRRPLHDDGEKTVFSHTGRFDGDAVLDLLLARPETSEFIVAKLWREFVSPQPDRREVERIARQFRESHYEIRVALGALLKSDAFYAPENRGVLVKSPIELVVGTLRQLDLHPMQTLPFALAAGGMGQKLFSPPNVKGWPGGDTWINTTTLLARKQFLDRLMRGDDAAVANQVAIGVPVTAPAAMMDAPRQAPDASALNDRDKQRTQRFARQMERGLHSVRFDSSRLLPTLPHATAGERNARLQALLLATPTQEPLDPNADALTFVRAVLLDAAFQLK